MDYHGLLNNRVLSAIRKRDVDKVFKLLLMPNFDLNYTAKKKVTPLILASKLGLYSVCEKLVSLKVEITCSDNDGRTALQHASYHGYTNIVELLINAGSDIHQVNQEGDQALHESVTGGNVDTVEVLLSAGSDVNRPNNITGSTPLDLAVLHDRTDIVNILLHAGANVHRRSSAEETALHFAVQVGSTDIVRLLLNAGANINSTNILGETPLALAVQEKKINVVKFLIETGCTSDQSDNLSPFFIACRQNSQDIICYLLSEGYNLSQNAWLKRYTYLRLEESNPKLLEYIFYRCENPMTLKESCRKRIRQSLRPNLRDKVPLLNLPKALKQWIIKDFIYDIQSY
ncbi:hypothetical protein ACF0H5_014766 [Mactra antiquata]